MLYVQWTCGSSSQTLSTVATPTTTSSTGKTCGNLTKIIDSCPDTSFSPYEPSFLTNSTVTFFGYPIYQEIACEGSTIALKCPTNMVLHIYAGYFGIQNQTSTETCLIYNKVVDDILTMPTMAYITEALKTIYSLCEEYNRCSLLATSYLDGGAELYPTVGKQLLVQVSEFITYLF